MNVALHPENPKTLRDRYRVFIEDVADGFYETDLQGNFVFFNQAFCEIFGYPEDEVLNRNYREFMDDTNALAAFEKFSEIYRTGNSFHDIVWEIVQRSGERRVIEISASLILDDNGDGEGFRGVIRDVTEKHKILQSLKNSEECAIRLHQESVKAERRHRAFLDFLPIPVFVFNLDGTVVYLNPAFEAVFGWPLKELRGKRIPFVPENLKAETRLGFRRLLNEKVVHGYETKRLTKDGRLRDIILDGSVYFDETGEPAGQVATLRDVTREKRANLVNRAMFRIARMLPDYHRLDDLLEFITTEVQELLAVEGAMVILLDDEKNELFFRVASFDDFETEKRMREIRYSAEKGVAGQVLRTGKPVIVADITQSPYFFHDVDRQTGFKTRNMLDVPIRTKDRNVGVLCVVNKKEGTFDTEDANLLSAVASSVAHPVENAHINEKLKCSYEKVKRMNHAKERVINHLSHELKTPVSILNASVGLIRKKLKNQADPSLEKILDRADKNIRRLLEMQYEIEDILRDKNFKTYRLLSALLDGCMDELEVLVSEETEADGVRKPFFATDLIDRIRSRMESLFAPRDAVPEKLRLDSFVEDLIQTLRPRFAHRRCLIVPRILTTSPIHIPKEVLTKVVEGLIRNAIENTPDGGRIAVTVREGKNGPEFEVNDFGVGITEENQGLIFESNFTTRETMQYSSGKQYDFNAGGKGFDLLRMKIFSERYHFDIQMFSKRCGFIPRDEDMCPGDIGLCAHCRTVEDCIHSGGTAMIVRFARQGGDVTYEPADG